jgi:quercetin dioxygenase-like cupin family protein
MIRLLPLLLCALSAAAQSEKVRNERVVVMEDRIAPGGSRSWRGDRPSMTVYFTPGELDVAGRPRKVLAGDAIFESAQTLTIKNAGASEVKLARIEFVGPGLVETWGAAGLSPNYKVLLENRYTRVYDIRIPAGAREPQHTHHDRVVVCLRGAQLEHLLPDGRVEPSTLATGEIAWRRGSTHIGHNLGKTDLWVIAVEPK